MRSFLIALLALISIPSYAGIPQSNEIVFDILRNGKPFGSHVLTFDKSGDEVQVNVDIEMKYKLGPLTLFKYEHDNTEIWKDGLLQRVETKTNDDGKDLWLKASYDDGNINITSSSGEYTGTKDLMTTSYWTMDMMSQDEILNTQYGRIHNVEIEDLGVVEKEIAGQRFKAHKFNFIDLDDDREAIFYYEVNTKQWVGLELSIRGSNLEYVRQTPLPVQYALKDK